MVRGQPWRDHGHRNVRTEQRAIYTFCYFSVYRAEHRATRGVSVKLIKCANCGQSINPKRDVCPFCSTPSATSVELADRLYRGRTLEDRVRAACELGGMATPGAVRLLRDALTNRYRYSPDLSHCVAQQLARIGEPAVPAIEALLKDRVAAPYAREALHILHPESVADPADDASMGGKVTGLTSDKVGLTLVRMKSSADLRLGLITGGAVVTITWLGTFLLGLIPNRTLGVALLSPASKVGDPFDNSWWYVWSLLGHFGGTVRLAVGPDTSIEDFARGGYDFNLTGLIPLAIFVGVMVLIGMYVRRSAHASVRARLMTLLMTAIIVALVVAVVAMLGGHSVAGSQTSTDAADYSLGFEAFSFLLRAFVITLLVGVFAFGIVELLATPHAAALRGAMSYAVLPALIVALVLPIVLGFYGDPRVSGERTRFIGLGTLVSPAAGSAVVPMTFGAQATAGVESADLGEVAKYVDASATGHNLTRFLRSYSSGRVFWYAGYKGAIGRLAAFALVVALLAIWIDTVRRYVRTMGAPTGIEGLTAGGYVGLLTGGAVALMALLLTIHVDLDAYDLAESASVALTVGLTWPALAYVLLIVTATGALTGYLLGTFWPSPTRHALLDFAAFAGLFGTTPTATAASPDSSLAAVRDAPTATPAVSIPAREPAPPQAPRSVPPVASHPAPLEAPPAPKSQPANAERAAPDVASAASSASDPVDQLRRLAELKDTGVLTPAEFDAAKQRILGTL